MSISFTVPIRIESEMNIRSNWYPKWRRASHQKRDVTYAFRVAVKPGALIPLPCVVTLTRIAPRRITDEHDNLRSGFKAVVDALADCIGINDGSPLVKWHYKQEKGTRYAVRVEIEGTT